MNNLLLHYDTRQAVAQFMAEPAHSLLLIGPDGSGKASVAKVIAGQLLELSPEKLPNYGAYLEIAPINNVISINEVRAATAFTKLKTVGERPIRRVLVVQNAEALTTEAQNAFLKLLEEPPVDTVIILTTTAHHHLLPTIVSRTQRISIKPVSQTEAIKYFEKQGITKSAIEKAYHISNGHVGVLQALLVGEQTHPMVEAIAEAKKLLAMPLFERLAQVDRLARNKESISDLLNAIQKICHAGLTAALKAGKDKDASVWLKHLRRALEAQQQWLHRPQPKLFLTHLFLNI